MKVVHNNASLLCLGVRLMGLKFPALYRRSSVTSSIMRSKNSNR